MEGLLVELYAIINCQRHEVVAHMEEIHSGTGQPALPFWLSSRWYHASTLSERIASLQGCPGEWPQVGPGKRERALRLLQRWKEQVPFNMGSFFADRLAIDGITEIDLLALLAESIGNVQARLSSMGPPGWLVELSQAFEGQMTTLPLKGPSSEIRATPAFLKPFQPLFARGIGDLQAGIDELCQWYAALPFDPQTIVSLLFANLSQSLLPKVNRTLVLELHVARLQGCLQGETSEQRFQSYVQLLSQTAEMLSLLEEYCVLARQVVEAIDLWAAYSLEFLTHLCADWNDIRTLFTPESDTDVLSEVRGGAGDIHRGGRGVMLLTFQSGFQLVYKPKSLAVDLHFQDLLNWLNQRGYQPAFRLMKLLDRGTYGWSEFVQPTTCTSQEEVERFYERQGAYLALLYALEAMDFHAENVIAAGEHPLLIDLEALFHPRLGKDGSARAEHPAQKALDRAVLGIGLLPTRVWSNQDAAGVDISGLGGQKGQLTPRATPKWEGVGTDEMRLVRERVEMALGHNRPQLDGQEVQTADYCEHIITGFTNVYRRLVANRDELLAEWFPRFAHDEIRFIARPTRTYSMLLQESFHPNLLRDALKRDRFFDRLWVGVQQEPVLARLIPAERADLLRGDIPMFTTHPDSRDLLTSQGERFATFFEEPSLELAKKRVQQMDEDDLMMQTRTIQASFASTFTGSDSVHATVLHQGESGAVERGYYLSPRHGALQSPWLHLSPALPTRERLIQAACAVGNRLYEVAVRSEDAVGWLGVTLINEREWQLGPVDQGLYAGTPGIVLFLAYLGKITGEASYTTLARSALPTVRYEVEQFKKRRELASIGAFEGLGAGIYLYSHLGTLWQEQALLEEADELVTFLPGAIEHERRLTSLGARQAALQACSACTLLHRRHISLRPLSSAETTCALVPSPCRWELAGIFPGRKPHWQVSHTVRRASPTACFDWQRRAGSSASGKQHSLHWHMNEACSRRKSRTGAICAARRGKQVTIQEWWPGVTVQQASDWAALASSRTQVIQMMQPYARK